MIDVAANWQAVRTRVAAAARRAGRDPESVRIIAVSKTKPVEMIEAVIAAGATDVGENYVQEAAEKIPAVRSGGAEVQGCRGAEVQTSPLARSPAPQLPRSPAPLTWHLIGHLQRNKAARAVELFQLIHTLDSVALGEALARHAERQERTVRVLVEVNIGGEVTKRGVAAAQVAGLLAALGSQQALLIDGLMAIPPPGRSADSARPYFRALHELRDRLQRDAPSNAPLRELSMGMSDDFEVAIEEGATLVRLGRAIFGQRAT